MIMYLYLLEFVFIFPDSLERNQNVTQKYVSSTIKKSNGGG